MNVLVIIIFIFCAGLSSGSILLISRLLREHELPFLRSIFYYTIFMTAFGFYGVWGQFIIISVAGEELTPELLSSVSVISLLLGLPFLVFGWLMLLRFAAESSGKRFGNLPTGLFIVINFAVIIILGSFISYSSFGEALPLIKYYYCTASILFAIISAILFLNGSRCILQKKDRITLAMIILAGSVAQSPVLLFVEQTVWMALAFVFILFATSTLIIMFLSYRAGIEKKSSADVSNMPAGMESIILKYEISPREAEIIREICNGLSNKEIADKLFISLQTVKDHTSRIYAKVNVRSRMQLMTLVHDIQAE